MTRQLLVRAATDTDVAAIRALMAPYVRAGKLLPRAVVTAEFLVATLGRRVVGTVALTALSPAPPSSARWSPTFRAEASVARWSRPRWTPRPPAASARWWPSPMSQRSSSDSPSKAPPTRPGCARSPTRGLGAVAPLHTTEVIASASAAKSATCAACARLAGCRQALMVRRIATTLRSHA
jgi:hypothetical protein